MEQAFEMRVPTRRVCDVTGIPNGMLGKWLHRGDLVTGQAEGKGKERSWTFHQTLEIATAFRLAKAGVSVPIACQAGGKIAHTGNDRRLPGLPILDHSKPRTIAAPTYVVVDGDRIRIMGALSEFDGHVDNVSAFAALPYHRLFNLTCQRLDLDPLDVIEQFVGKRA